MKLLKTIQPNLNNNIINEIGLLEAENTGGYVAADITSLLSKVNELYNENQCNYENQIQLNTENQSNELEIKSESQFNNENEIVWRDFWINLFQQARNFVSPSCLRGITTQISQTSFDDIIGCEEAKIILNRILLFYNPIKYKKYEKFHIKSIGGILLHGPPGNSKTKLILACASSYNFPIITLSSADIYSPYVGDAEYEIRKIFQLARQGSPCILFIDEIDTFISNRNNANESSNSVESRILSTLLNEMDGIGNNQNTNQKENHIIVMACTNRIDAIDNALLRKGRFDHILEIKLPNLYEINNILIYYCNKYQLNEIQLLKLKYSMRIGLSGADIENLCREEKFNDFRDNINNINNMNE